MRHRRRLLAVKCLLCLILLHHLFFVPGSQAQEGSVAACSQGGTLAATVSFVNNSFSRGIAVSWVDGFCREILYSFLDPQTVFTLSTAVGHVWRVRDVDTGALLGEYVVDQIVSVIRIDDISQMYLPLLRQQPVNNIGETDLARYLAQGWIVEVAHGSLRTYDFTQAQAAGRRTVEIRSWLLIGTTGWVLIGSSAADYTLEGQHIFLRTATGYTEEWFIAETQSDRMLVESNVRPSQIWFNCSAQVWPLLIFSSTRGCNR